MRRRLIVSIFVLATTLAAFGWSVRAFDPPAETAEKDFSAELPKIAPKTPADEQKTFKPHAGFHAELVAAEPLVRSPMAMDFDEYGRAFVVELPEYNQYASPAPHGKGDVKLLEDTDGDGRFDKATVYVADLDYPTAVACWDGGVLVGVAPDLLYCKDTDGDGKADVRQKLYTGFGTDKSGEGQINCLRWRIDNRFHVPCGLDGGDVVPVLGHASRVPTESAAKSSEAPRPISVRGQHLLLDPRDWSVEATSGGGQHGMGLDEWCLRVFVCGNSEPVHLVMYDGRYLARNPYLSAPAAAINIAPEGKFTKLMRISQVEPWRVLRTRLRKKGLIPGSDEGGTPSGFFTAATGITVYRGDAWPPEYRGQLFVGEAANNLIYRAKLSPNGVGLTAARADEDAEFFAAGDNWFRPVQFANAPDGTLYVLDMYRELIEGAAFLAPQILKHMDPSAGFDKGRIYRLAPDGFQYQKPPRLGELSTVELVALLEHPNGWRRDTASRLIYQRQDRSAIGPLKKLAAESRVPLARTTALYSLAGLDALDAETVVRALTDETPQCRIHALRLAERFVTDPPIPHAVIPLAQDRELTVRYQAAFSLGALNDDGALQALLQLVLRDGADSWMQLAVLSSIGQRRGEFFSTLVPHRADQNAPHVRAILNALAVQIGAANEKHELAVFIKQLEALPAGEKPFAEELVRSLIGKQPAAAKMLAAATGGKAAEILAGLIRDARQIAADEAKPAPERADAVKTLANAPLDDIEPLFADLLHSRQPQPVQVATIQTLARFDSDRVPALLVAVWPSQTPQLRATTVETLFSRPQWIAAFLNAVEKEQIARADIDPARIALLQRHDDRAIRARAEKLFAGTTLARRQDVVDAYQKSLDLKGDVDRGRQHFKKVCAACHKLEGVGESIGADLNAIKDRGTAAVLLNILDPNREVKPQFLGYVAQLSSGLALSGMITAENANSLTLRKADGTQETVLRVDIDELKSTGLSFMPEGLEQQLDPQMMADLLAYLNAAK